MFAYPLGSPRGRHERIKTRIKTAYKNAHKKSKNMILEGPGPSIKKSSPKPRKSDPREAKMTPRSGPGGPGSGPGGPGSGPRDPKTAPRAPQGPEAVSERPWWPPRADRLGGGFWPSGAPFWTLKNVHLTCFLHFPWGRFATPPKCPFGIFSTFSEGVRHRHLRDPHFTFLFDCVGHFLGAFQNQHFHIFQAFLRISGKSPVTLGSSHYGYRSEGHDCHCAC